MEQSKLSRLVKALELAVPNRPFTITERELKRSLTESKLFLLTRKILEISCKVNKGK